METHQADEGHRFWGSYHQGPCVSHEVYDFIPTLLLYVLVEQYYNIFGLCHARQFGGKNVCLYVCIFLSIWPSIPSDFTEQQIETGFFLCPEEAEVVQECKEICTPIKHA